MIARASLQSRFSTLEQNRDIELSTRHADEDPELIRVLTRPMFLRSSSRFLLAVNDERARREKCGKK